MPLSESIPSWTNEGLTRQRQDKGASSHDPPLPEQGGRPLNNPRIKFTNEIEDKEEDMALARYTIRYLRGDE